MALKQLGYKLRWTEFGNGQRVHCGTEGPLSPAIPAAPAYSSRGVRWPEVPAKPECGTFCGRLNGHRGAHEWTRDDHSQFGIIPSQWRRFGS